MKIPDLSIRYPVEPFFADRPISLVPMEQSDLSYLYRLRYETICPYYEKEDRTWDVDEQRKWIESNVQLDHAYIIKRNDRRVGVIGVYPVTADALWIRHFYVEPNVQGTGVGSEVMDGLTAMADWLKKDIELYKVPRDGPVSFYERFDFSEVETREHETYMRRSTETTEARA